MKIHKSGFWVLWYECVGFAMIISCCWLVELTGAANLVFGGESHAVDWRGTMMET
jgi:hypothetical protein